MRKALRRLIKAAAEGSSSPLDDWVSWRFGGDDRSRMSA
jgi:hypothetical protein